MPASIMNLDRIADVPPTPAGRRVPAAVLSAAVEALRLITCRKPSGLRRRAASNRPPESPARSNPAASGPPAVSLPLVWFSGYKPNMLMKPSVAFVRCPARLLWRVGLCLF